MFANYTERGFRREGRFIGLRGPMGLLALFEVLFYLYSMDLSVTVGDLVGCVNCRDKVCINF